MTLSSNRNGFTIIELVVVILLIGILSAVALPRFINITDDARIAAVESMHGTVQTAAAQFFAACEATEDCRDAVYGQLVFMPPYNQQVRITAGYPDAGDINSGTEINDIITSSGFDVISVHSDATRWAVPGIDNCFVQYNQPPINGQPGISIETSGC